MTRRLPVAALLAAATFVGGGAAYAATATIRSTTNSYNSVTDGEWRTSGAVIRVGTAVYVHENSTHAAVNVTSVEVETDGDVLVRIATVPGQRVVACVTDEDETLSRLGIQVGCSGGLHSATLQFWRAGKRVRADDPTLGTLGNVWLQTTSFVPNPA